MKREPYLMKIIEEVVALHVCACSQSILCITRNFWICTKSFITFKFTSNLE